MPGAAHSKLGQDCTQFTIADIVAAAGQRVDHFKNQIEGLAFSQNMTPKAWSQDAPFMILASRTEVEDHRWCDAAEPGMFLRCTPSSATFTYPPASSHVVTAQCNVHWAQGRDAELELAMFDILTALSHGKPLVVHCERSFRRGPVGTKSGMDNLDSPTTPPPQPTARCALRNTLGWRQQRPC